MTTIGRIESLWRYPVKSMRGEQLQQAFAGFSGIYGDRIYAFQSTAAPKGFPYLTAREQEQMLLYKAAYRDAGAMAQPPNLAEAETAGATPVYAAGAKLDVEVESPNGQRFAIDDPALQESLRQGIRDKHQLELLRSDRALTDCRPVSLFSLHTAAQLAEEVGVPIDKRRFRANVYIELNSGQPFEEDTFVGRTLRLGPKATIIVVDRDPRCKMITLDPDTAEPNPGVMRTLAKNHETKAGVYAVVLTEGILHPGDEISLVN